MPIETQCFCLFSEKSYVKLKIDVQFECDTGIPQEHLDAAIKFGIEKIDATHINAYIVAFLRKLLLQREKLEKGLLDNYLIPAITEQWQKLLSSLEEKNRKLINIDNGSVIFLFFCPTIESQFQLQDDNWRVEIQQNTAKLLQMLGKVILVIFSQCTTRSFK